MTNIVNHEFSSVTTQYNLTTNEPNLK